MISFDKRSIDINELLKRINNEKINLDNKVLINTPDNNLKSKIIESIILGIPLPNILTISDQDDIHLAIQGEKIIYTISEFYKNNFKLENLNIREDLNELDFKNLKGKDHNNFLDYKINLTVINPDTEENNKINIYDNLNAIYNLMV